MGSARSYRHEGGFEKIEWGEEERAIGGVKVLYHKKTSRNDLPIYAYHSEMYLKRSKNGQIVQIRVYKDRKVAFDIDLDTIRDHDNPTNRRTFRKGTIHVQEFSATRVDGKITISRSKDARDLTEAEKRKYGDIIKAIRKENSRVKKSGKRHGHNKRVHD